MTAGEHWESLGLRYNAAQEALDAEQVQAESLCKDTRHRPETCPAGEFCRMRHEPHTHQYGAVCTDCCPHEITDGHICYDCDSILDGTDR